MDTGRRKRAASGALESEDCNSSSAQPAGPPVDLGNMRHLGVRGLDTSSPQGRLSDAYASNSLIGERQENLRPQHPAAQQDKTVGRTELPHRGPMLSSKGAKGGSASHHPIH
jgi:hypothetical protein